MKTTTKSGAFAASRYSNEDPVNLSGGVGFDWTKLDISGMFKNLTDMATSIWGKGDKYISQAYKKMYENQQKTNTVLWVVIGLVVALGVFLVIRKTK